MSELPWLPSLVKHNVAAKHGSSKPLTSNELWLLELRIKSTRRLASIPNALWDMCKSSIETRWLLSVRGKKRARNYTKMLGWNAGSKVGTRYDARSILDVGLSLFSNLSLQ